MKTPWKSRMPFVVVTVLLAVVSWLYVRETVLMESKLIGAWTYTVPYKAYPRYSSSLEMRSDGTYVKREEYVAAAGSSPAVSVFEGQYKTSGSGLETGMIAFTIHNASAMMDGRTVCESPDGGYLAICRYGFDKSGRLMIIELVGGTAGHEKNPAELDAGTLIPSWEYYSKGSD